MSYSGHTPPLNEREAEMNGKIPNDFHVRTCDRGVGRHTTSLMRRLQQPVTPLRGTTREMQAGKAMWSVAVYWVDLLEELPPVAPLPA